MEMVVIQAIERYGRLVRLRARGEKLWGDRWPSAIHSERCRKLRWHEQMLLHRIERIVAHTCYVAETGKVEGSPCATCISTDYTWLQTYLSSPTRRTTRKCVAYAPA